FRRVGVWKRARYFSSDLTSREEIQNVRNKVGLIDVSTLGKFRLHGPDALKVLQRVYISDMSQVRPGKLKYSAMCNQDGCLLDDGVVTKLGENDYYLTTSTGRAGGTIEWFRYQTRYDGWDFNAVNLTDTLAAINLAGPQAREVLVKICDADLSNEALPYMGFQEVTLGGQVKAKVLRLGFVGELSYELHLPSSQAQSVWNWLMEAGAELGIRPFGLEAQFVLRLEKGHVIIGQESEARTNLLDLGLGFLWARKDLASKKVGAPALRFAEKQKDRLKLVGFTMNDPDQTPGDGAIVYEGQDVMGFVCTSRKSVTLGQSIGLALVQAPLTKVGGTLNIFQNDGPGEEHFQATVSPTPFYDPQGQRLRM
ncbi:MAG: aminomethyltransferase family protein, partial [Deltaproteobacteria bacterium]|nr:aminomethyltransferase family protein [Deltaproteobacteria bacterium]